MNGKTFAAVVSVFAAAAASTASATTIDFETGAPRAFVATTPLTTEYSGMGVTFSGADGAGGSILDQAGNFGIAARSGSDFLAFNVFARSGATETVSFATPVKDFSIYVGLGSPEAYTASAFDAFGNLLGTAVASPAGGVYGELSLPFSGVSTVTFSGSGVAYVADDLSFNTVPEPSAWALMLVGFGLAGAALRRGSPSRRPRLGAR